MFATKNRRKKRKKKKWTKEKKTEKKTEKSKKNIEKRRKLEEIGGSMEAWKKKLLQTRSKTQLSYSRGTNTVNERLAISRWKTRKSAVERERERQ